MKKTNKKRRPARPARPAIRQAARPEPQRPTRPTVPLLAQDGYANAAAFLGEASPLLSSGTFLRSDLTSDPELLTVLYRESWLTMRIIDMPSEDMTRAWYRLSTALPEADLQALRRLEARHSVKQEVTNAIRCARLYVGALALMVIRGEENRLDQPLNPDFLLPDCFQGLLVLDRAQGISPSSELVSDLDDPDFGLPVSYTVHLDTENYRTVTLHHSRVLRFIGRELPRTETVRENYWGASEMEHIWDELQKRSAASANIAQLIFQANITTLRMSDFGELLSAGTDQQRRNMEEAMQLENRLRTSFGLQLLSRDDSLENHAYSFTGLGEIYEQFMMDMAGASEIPATRLFGRSPQGMNATGESDLKNYYELIAQMQERHLRPALEKLLPVMALSCWGFVPSDMEILFEPVMTTGLGERAEIMERLSAPVIDAFSAGLLTREQALTELRDRGAEYGFYRKLQL